MSDAPAAAREPLDGRSADAVVHLQRAAVEFIAAARALLDVAEEVVLEPAGLVALVSDTIGAIVGAAGVVASDPAKPAASRQSPGPTVEHIRIS